MVYEMIFRLIKTTLKVGAGAVLAYFIVTGFNISSPIYAIVLVSLFTALIDMFFPW